MAKFIKLFKPPKSKISDTIETSISEVKSKLDKIMDRADIVQNDMLKGCEDWRLKTLEVEFELLAHDFIILSCTRKSLERKLEILDLTQDSADLNTLSTYAIIAQSTDTQPIEKRRKIISALINVHEATEEYEKCGELLEELNKIN